MNKFKQIDNDFYLIKQTSDKKTEKYWNKIKNNKDLLKWAIKPTKDRFKEKDIVNGLAICDAILVDYENIDKDIYEELINLIYSNTDIARIVQNGYTNGGCSYLLMTLWNDDLKLTEEQKKFAVLEAMNKIGTTRYKKAKEEYAKKLEEHNITDDITTTIEIDGSLNPIGAKTKMEYMNYLFYSLSDTQAHGRGAFDIRYWILRNNNWSIEEKQKLIMDFWYDDEEYDEHLEQWEWNIVNDDANYQEDTLDKFDKCSLYDYSYNHLLTLYHNKGITDRIWKEIKFCEQMHELRPQQWELKCAKQIVLEKK